MKYKYLVFDFDGTLFDTTDLCYNLGSLYLHSKGIEVVGDLHKELHALTWEEGCQHLISYFPYKISKEEIMRELDSFLLKKYVDEVKPKPNVISFLQHAHNQGVPMCILSTGNRSLIIEVLKKYNIAHLFEDIYTSDILKINKQSTKIYHTLASLKNTTTSQLCIFEDDFIATKNAKKAGCYVVAIKDNYQDVGIENIADIYITDFKSLEGWI